MSLNGIDISNWQAGIDLAAVPCDFVISKATEGVGYVSADCARQVEQALSLGKIVGVYHYVNGSGAQAEAQYFIGNCRNWLDKVFWCIDWEQQGNSAWGNTGYLDAVIKEVARLTGKPPILYASASVYPSDVAAANNCGTWVAQYADMNPTGYQDTPWNEGAYSCAIRQYASTGRLPGYGANLDLNKFYGDASQLRAYIPGTTGQPAPAPAPAPQQSGSDTIPKRKLTVPVHYALRQLNGAWWPDITNFGLGDDGYAGSPDVKHDLLTAWVDHGSLRYRTHNLGGDWNDWVDHSNKADTVNGCAGVPGVPIDGVQFYYTTPAGEPYSQAYYRSQTVMRAGWLKPCSDDGTNNDGLDGWAGIIGEPLDRLQLAISDGNPF